jgi:hypothetical protein
MREVITVDDVENGEVAIHAMKLREAYERFDARLDDELAGLLEQCAARDGVHKSDTVREALRAYLV